MKRRHFLTGLAAVACSGGSEPATSSSVPVGPTPGSGELADWPDPILAVDELAGFVAEAAVDTPFEGMEALVEQVDWELRAIARLAPESAALGAALIEKHVVPALNVVGELRERPDMEEDEMGALVASVFDVTATAEELRGLLDASEAELAVVGTFSPDVQAQLASTLREVAHASRQQLAIAGRGDNALARQLIDTLDQTAADLMKDPRGLYDRAREALDAAESMPAAPPFANLCANLQYTANNIDRFRAVMAANMQMVAATASGVVWSSVAASVLVLPYVTIPVGMALGVFVGLGVMALMMPFLLYQPPTVYEPIHFRMCDCEGN